MSVALPSSLFVSALIALALGMLPATANAQVVAAEPVAPIVAPFPDGAPTIEVPVVLQLVVDAAGHVESAVVTAHAPPAAPQHFDDAAILAAKCASFHPSMRDGQPIRSRVEYVVVFQPPAPAAAGASPSTAPLPPAEPPPTAPGGIASPQTPETAPLSTDEQDEDYAQVVEVRGVGWSSPRGLGDQRALHAGAHRGTPRVHRPWRAVRSGGPAAAARAARRCPPHPALREERSRR